jgi:hypothetical protein
VVARNPAECQKWKKARPITAIDRAIFVCNVSNRSGSFLFPSCPPESEAGAVEDNGRPGTAAAERGQVKDAQARCNLSQSEPSVYNCRILTLVLKPSNRAGSMGWVVRLVHWVMGRSGQTSTRPPQLSEFTPSDLCPALRLHEQLIQILDPQFTSGFLT